MKYFLIVFCLLDVFVAMAQGLTVYSEQRPAGTGINSPYYEESPVLHPSGQQLYFTRQRHPGNLGGTADKGDIWVSKKGEENEWELPVNLGSSVNTPGWNSIIGFANNGDEMYLSSEYKDKDGILRKGVMVSYKKANSWAEPVLMEIEHFRNKSEHQSGWITLDGNVLLLSIETASGYGTEDLYVCFRQSPYSWSSPRNLGFMINSTFQEMTPFLAEDKKTLIFATNGRAGLGSRDLFISQRLDDSWRNWTEPESLGSNVNTAGTELSFSFRQGDDYAWLVSTQNSEGYGDIKQVKITADIVPQPLDSVPQTPLISAVDATEVVLPAPEPEPKIVEQVAPLVERTAVTLEVLDALTLDPVKAFVAVLGGKSDVAPQETSTNGVFSAALEKGLTYTFTITANGYLEEQLVLLTAGQDEWSESIMIQPLAVGNTITLSHVLFEQSTATIVKGSEIDLDRVVHMMQMNQAIEIHISGHTDNQGPIALNIELSEKRVTSVIDYIVAKGVEPNRLTGKGYGPTKPIASNASEQTRQLNRRVEFTITKGN